MEPIVTKRGRGNGGNRHGKLDEERSGRNETWEKGFAVSRDGMRAAMARQARDTHGTPSLKTKGNWHRNTA